MTEAFAMGGGGAVAVMVIKEKHIVRAFRNAGATDPRAAVVPEDIGVHQRLIFGKLRRRAILREAGPGRYYLDELSWEAYRSMRRRIAVAMLLMVAIVALALYLRQP